MIHAYVKFSEFARDVEKHSVFNRVRFYQPSPQDVPNLPSGTKMIGEMRFSAAVGGAVKTFFRPHFFTDDSPVNNPEKDAFGVEFITLNQALSSIKCKLIVGEVGDYSLAGEIDDPALNQKIKQINESRRRGIEVPPQVPSPDDQPTDDMANTPGDEAQPKSA